MHLCTTWLARLPRQHVPPGFKPMAWNDILRPWARRRICASLNATADRDFGCLHKGGSALRRPSSICIGSYNALSIVYELDQATGLYDFHSGPDARPSGRQGASWGVRMGAPSALRVLVLVPSMRDADVDSLEQQARSQCTPAPVQTALGALTILKAQGHLSPAHARHARLLAAAMHSGPDAPPTKRQSEQAAIMGLPGALRVLVLVPCMLETDLQALEEQARSQCIHPPGWEIEYRRCDPRDRIGAYNTALAESSHDILVFMQPYLRLYQPGLFTELGRVLQDADVVGCGGALRWVQKDWTLDLPAYKDYETLRDKLLVACREGGEGFALM
jgi:hypothetical protein